jgi:hypothetical protein
VFERALGTRGPAGLGATANIFLGQVEAPLLVRPYIARMNRYELLLLMTAGMATIAGSVMVIYAAMLGEQFQGVLGHLLTKSIMSVPASILFAHVMLPEPPPSRTMATRSRRGSTRHDGRDHPRHRRRAQHLPQHPRDPDRADRVRRARQRRDRAAAGRRRRAAVARAHRRLDLRAARLADGHPVARGADRRAR